MQCDIKFLFQITEHFFRKILFEKSEKEFLSECGGYVFVLCQNCQDQDGRELGMIRIGVYTVIRCLFVLSKQSLNLKAGRAKIY